MHQSQSPPHDLTSAIATFQRETAPLVREELARLAHDGQRPSQLFIACADSRLVTSMITSSRPGDLFTVRNIGNLVPLPPPPGTEAACDSVAAAVEYAVEVLRVSSITVCGHSGCGAMQALLASPPPPDGSPAPHDGLSAPHAPPVQPRTTPHRPKDPADNSTASLTASAPTTPATSLAPAHRTAPSTPTPLTRWLRHGHPSLIRLTAAKARSPLAVAPGSPDAPLAEPQPGRALAAGAHRPVGHPLAGTHPPAPPLPRPHRAKSANHHTPSASATSTCLSDPYQPLADRLVADDAERLSLLNVVQQLDHLMAHPCVAHRVATGELRLQGMYFHVAEAQGYLLDSASGLFSAVRPEMQAAG